MRIEDIILADTSAFEHNSLGSRISMGVAVLQTMWLGTFDPTQEQQVQGWCDHSRV